jgi:hypothetical protein
VRVKAAPIDRTLILKDKIWTGRLRIDRVVIFQASGSRVFSAVALIGLAVEASAAIASVAAADLVAVDLADLADSAAEDFAGAVDSGAGAEN